MTEQWSSEVDVKMVKIGKSALFKVHFFGPNALGNSIFFGPREI